MSGTRSPSAERLPAGVAPRTFQGRLTLAFVAVVTVTLGLVGLLVVNRLGAYFNQQQEEELAARAQGVAQYVILIAESTDSVRAGRPVISEAGVVDPIVVAELSRERQQRIVTDQLAKANVRIRLGFGGGRDDPFRPAANGVFEERMLIESQPGQVQEQLTSPPVIMYVKGSRSVTSTRSRSSA